MCDNKYIVKPNYEFDKVYMFQPHYSKFNRSLWSTYCSESHGVQYLPELIADFDGDVIPFHTLTKRDYINTHDVDYLNAIMRNIGPMLVTRSNASVLQILNGYSVHPDDRTVSQYPQIHECLQNWFN